MVVMGVHLGVAVMVLMVLPLTLGQSFFEQGLPSKCLKGPMHKDKPGPESDDFLECKSWNKMACCNVNVSHEIHHHGAKTLYNYHWDRCGSLSPTCEQYLKHEECFYQCEPMLTYYERPQTEGYIRDAPVCASYCDGFYEACKNDMTCVQNWLGDWTYAADGLNSCPQDSKCVPFSQMYGSGKGLCDKMWGDAFYYEADSNDCMVMHFNPEGENPNLKGNPTSSSSNTLPTLLLTLTLLILTT